MKYRVLVTPDAAGDIDDVFAFIARDDLIAAAKLIKGFRARIRSLASLPKRCPLAPENGLLDIGEIRHLLYGRYRIVFGIEGRDVIILAVRHAARRPSLKD